MSINQRSALWYRKTVEDEVKQLSPYCYLDVIHAPLERPNKIEKVNAGSLNKPRWTSFLRTNIHAFCTSLSLPPTFCLLDQRQ